jgi:hypothetical protein
MKIAAEAGLGISSAATQAKMTPAKANATPQRIMRPQHIR